MKNQILKIRTIGNAFLSVSFLLMGLLAVSSCGNPKPEDPKDVAEDHNEAKFDNAKEDDAKFLVNAAEINLEEIQLGQLSQNNSLNAEVKDLGQMMVTDHMKAQGDLIELAALKQISIPTSLTEDGQDANKKLMDKQGKDFDKEYCDMMVKGHKDAISKFEKASTDATDPEIRNWATSMLPDLRAHLDKFVTCQDKLNKM